MRTLVNGTSYDLSIDVERYPEAKRARQGDQVKIGCREYEVLSVQPDGLSRVVLLLTTVG